MFAYEVTKECYSKMGIASLHTVYAILFVLHESTAYSIDGNLCLETIIKFIFDQKKCDFDQDYAVKLLNDYNITCQTKCKVTIEDIYFYSNRLLEVDIKFNDKTYAYEPCTWSFSIHALSMNIICPTWNKVKVPVGGYCKVDEQCHGSNHSGVCQLGKCVCKDGYVLYNLECHEGNLTLNQTCSFSEQCVGSPYASCLGGICSCIEGYTAKNSTDCVQSQEITLPSSLQHHQEEAKIGTTLGALFGGILLGVILTTAAVAIIYRRSKKHVNKREELNVTFSDNDACSSAKVADPNAFQNIQTNAKKISKSEVHGHSRTVPRQSELLCIGGKLSKPPVVLLNVNKSVRAQPSVVTMVYNESAECPLFPDNPGHCDALIHVRRGVSSISLIGCLFMIVVIWLFKKHVAFSQRLILYLSIAAFFDSIAYLMGDIRPDGPTCDFQAWWLSFFDWCVLMWVCIITFNLFMNVVKTKNIERFEIPLHVLGWVVPAIISFLPFAGNHYGPAGAWCWIVNDLGWRFGIWYGPLFIAIAVLVVTYVYIIVTLNRRLSTWHGTYDPDSERQAAMLKEDIKSLRAYPFIYLAASIFPLINRIQNAAAPDDPVFALVILAALTAPLHGAMNAIVFGMDRETLRKLTPTQIKVAFMARMTKTASIQEFHPQSRTDEEESQQE